MAHRDSINLLDEVRNMSFPSPILSFTDMTQKEIIYSCGPNGLAETNSQELVPKEVAEQQRPD
jgi:hypothetical protein